MLTNLRQELPGASKNFWVPGTGRDLILDRPQTFEHRRTSETYFRGLTPVLKFTHMLEIVSVSRFPRHLNLLLVFDKFWAFWKFLVLWVSGSTFGPVRVNFFFGQMDDLAISRSQQLKIRFCQFHFLKLQVFRIRILSSLFIC